MTSNNTEAIVNCYEEDEFEEPELDAEERISKEHFDDVDDIELADDDDEANLSEQRNVVNHILNRNPDRLGDYTVRQNKTIHMEYKAQVRSPAVSHQRPHRRRQVRYQPARHRWLQVKVQVTFQQQHPASHPVHSQVIPRQVFHRPNRQSYRPACRLFLQQWSMPLYQIRIAPIFKWN